jgi:hypothetical protein
MLRIPYFFAGSCCEKANENYAKLLEYFEGKFMELENGIADRLISDRANVLPLATICTVD